MKRILITIVSLVLAPVASLTAAEKSQPNILHIHADDHRADGLHALGTELLQTPNLDSLVASGMTFTRAYTMGSMVGGVCLPSRTMMLTGKSWLRIPKDKEGDPAATLPKVLSAAGYQTFHVGKGGNAYTAGIKAFDQSTVLEDFGEMRKSSSERQTDVVLNFLGERQAAKPFYIYLAPPVPHDPRLAAPEFASRYAAKDVPLPAAFLPLHPFDNGEQTVRDETLAPWPRTPEDTKQQLADYYACVTGLDHHIGRIFAALKASGQWSNTVVIFSGDNGLSMGEHGLFGKQNLYEFGGMHVPLVIAGPGIKKGKSEAFVYLMDLFPTFAELGGAKTPPDVEGKSLIPLLTGKQAKLREVGYTAYRDCQRAIRDDRWKLIRYPQINRTQLFDLKSDPRELNDLAAKPEHAAKITKLTALLEKEMARNGDTISLTVTNPKPAAWTPPAAKVVQPAAKKSNETRKPE